MQDKFPGVAPLARAGALAGALLLATLPAGAYAQELPRITPDLENAAGIACIRIGTDGAVTGAFLISSTGDALKDRHLLEWVRKLHWLEAEPGEKLRNTWFPMPIAFGRAEAPEPPESCGPPPRPVT